MQALRREHGSEVELRLQKPWERSRSSLGMSVVIRIPTSPPRWWATSGQSAEAVDG